MNTLNTLAKFLLKSKVNQKLSKQNVNYLLSVLAISAISTQTQAEGGNKSYKVDIKKLAEEAGVKVSDVSNVELKLAEGAKGEIVNLGNGIFEVTLTEGVTDVSFIVGGSGVESAFTSSFSANSVSALKQDFANSWNEFIDSLNADNSSMSDMQITANFDASALGLAVLAVAASGGSSATVTNTNNAPTIVSTGIADASTDEDAAYSYDASANFADVDTGDTATYTATLADDSVLPGWLTITSAGVLSGTPLNANVGSIEVKVTRTDTAGASASDTFALTVANTNDTPVALADTIIISEDAAATIVSVLDNDTDVDTGDILAIYTKTNGTNGTVTLVDGILSYTPDADFNGVDTFQYKVTDGTDQSDLATVTVNVTAVNDDPTGSVTIAGDAKTGQTLTAANTLADVDGIGAISYQWAKDGTDIVGATSQTLVLADTDIGSTFTVKASYTDGDGTAETVTSTATDAVVDIVKLIQIRSAEAITASQASIDLNNGNDYTTDASDIVYKFDLYLDAEGVDLLNANVTEIRGTEFTISLDATQIDGVADFATSTDVSWIMDMVFESGVFDVSTINQTTGAIALGSSTALVDIDTTNDGARPPILIEQKIGTVYVNPKASLDSIDISVQGVTMSTDDTDVTPLSYAIDIV